MNEHHSNRKSIAGKIVRRLLAYSRSFARLFYWRQQQRIFAVQPSPDRGSESDLLISTGDTLRSNGLLMAIMQTAGTWSPDEIERRKKDGDRYYLALDHGQCVHYAWVTQKARIMKPMGFSAQLPPKQAWIYDCYTVPTHRGRSVYPQVLKKIVRDMDNAGGDAVWVDVNVTNQASIRGVLKTGFEEVQRLDKLVLLQRFTLFRRTVVIQKTWAAQLLRMPTTWH